MTEVATARLFKHGRSQAVRLPKEFRMPGDRVRIRKEGKSVVLDPIDDDLDEWFAELQKYFDVEFMEDGREQPPMPDDDDKDLFP